MVASVLSSPRAVEMSILAVRAFVPFRQILATNRQLAAKLDELDHKIAAHDKSIADHGTSIDAHRKGILSLYSAIENLMPTLTNRQIGFKGKGAGKDMTPAPTSPSRSTPRRPPAPRNVGFPSHVLRRRPVIGKFGVTRNSAGFGTAKLGPIRLCDRLRVTGAEN